MYPPGNKNSGAGDAEDSSGPDSVPNQDPYRYPPPARPPNWPPAPGPPSLQGYPAYNPGSYPVQVNGSTILVLGILSFFCVGFVLGPIAWIMGNNALAAIKAGQADPIQFSNVSAGRVCGIIGTCLHYGILLIYLVIIVLGIVAALIGAAASSSH